MTGAVVGYVAFSSAQNRDRIATGRTRFIDLALIVPMVLGSDCFDKYRNEHL